MYKLFVYGSLKRGFKQHDRHMRTARFICVAQTAEPVFSLVAVCDSDADNPYPGMMTGGAYHIKGELYEIDDALLKRLDEYEGEGYQRIEIALDNGDSAQTYVYIGKDTVISEDHPYVRIEGRMREWFIS